MLKRRHVISLIVIAAFAIFSIYTYQSSLTPYVTFAQAKSINGSVQVRGVLTGDKISTSESGKLVQFMLRDEQGETVPVFYQGVKPEGMETATSIVAIGKYKDGKFMAEKLLVKCPSKYQSAQGSVNKP